LCLLIGKHSPLKGKLFSVDDITPVFRKLTVVWSVGEEGSDLEVVVSGTTAPDASDGEGEVWVLVGVVEEGGDVVDDCFERERVDVFVFGGDGVGSSLGTMSDSTDGSIEVKGVFSGTRTVSSCEVGAKDEDSVGVFHEGFHAECFGVVVDGEAFHGWILCFFAHSMRMDLKVFLSMYFSV